MRAAWYGPTYFASNGIQGNAALYDRGRVGKRPTLEDRSYDHVS
jgi:hypothetical protein